MVTLFLAGDVMTGRGIDQILPHPSQPRIYEDYATSALEYVALAERAHGTIPRPVDFPYVWGDALDVLSFRNPDLRIVNLETAVTTSGSPEPKGINYRMHPGNIGVLKAAHIDCCALANNHVLDWGEPGLLDTLDILKGTGILTAGAGRDGVEAARPAVIHASSACRVLIFSLGMESSGIPPHWAAGAARPGIRFLPDLSERMADSLTAEINSLRRPGDIVVVSIHWGSNWGYEIPAPHERFAHALIDLGACDILHGHSSHHARAIEIYRQKLILYGCGDFINDYEGISGREEYRGYLSPMYLAEFDESAGKLSCLTIVIFKMHRFRLRHAPSEDVKWLMHTLNPYNKEFGTELHLNRDGSLEAAHL
ncbi:MAG TPA: CapA family protein [Hyphomicrobiales bacterium]|nr:CapA family protein [Hyphomicrobiales bacterium]